MKRHRDDQGELVRGRVNFDYVGHHDNAGTGLLVVSGVPAEVCPACAEYWLDDSTGYRLVGLIRGRRPAPGEVRTIALVEAQAA